MELLSWFSCGKRLEKHARISRKVAQTIVKLQRQLTDNDRAVLVKAIKARAQPEGLVVPIGAIEIDDSCYSIKFQNRSINNIQK